MKQVSGFLSNDGKFFERQEEAVFHDAQEALVKVIAATDVDEERFLELINRFGAEIGSYLNAKIACESAAQHRAAKASR